MENLKYKVIYSSRRTLSICISPDNGIVVRAPHRASEKKIEQFVSEKAGWIRKHVENNSNLIRLNQGKRYIDGESHLFMGKENVLKINHSQQIYVSHYDNIIEAGVNGAASNMIKPLLDNWYMQKAREIFPEKTDEILRKFSSYNFSPSSLVVRSLRSRWGSCNSEGKITLSSELIKLDQVFLEYVIIHELCHLKYHHHGKDYYRLLKELFPNYKAVRKELRKYITA